MNEDWDWRVLCGMNQTTVEAFLSNRRAICEALGADVDDSTVPVGVGLVSQERPPEYVFDHFRRLHGISEEKDN